MYKTAQTNTDATTDKLETLTDTLGWTAESWVQMGFAAAEAADEEHSATEIMLNSIRQQLKALLAKAIAQAIVNAIGMGPLGIFAAGLAGLSAGMLFEKLIPTFAEGGFTPGATLYVAGEAGKEYVAPNKQLNDPITGPIIQGLEYNRTTGEYPAWMSSIGHVPNYRGFTSAMRNMQGFSTPTASYNSVNNNYHTTTTDNADVVQVLGRILRATEKQKGVLFQDTAIRKFGRREQIVDRQKRK
jgi:hypothetical protein